MSMRRLAAVLTCLGTAGMGIGLFALLDAYWRWTGVALGYRSLVSGLVGSGLLVVGIGCLLTARLITPCGGRTPDRIPDAKSEDAAR